MMRKLLIALAILVLISVGIKKAKLHREAEWRGLTEDEARSKLDERLPSRMAGAKRSVVSDKVIAKMLERGVIRENPDVSAEAPVTAQPMAAVEG